MVVLQRSLSSSSSYPSIIRGPQASQQTRSLAQTLRILLRNPVRSASWSYDILKLNKMFYKKLPCTFLTIKAPRKLFQFKSKSTSDDPMNERLSDVDDILKLLWKCIQSSFHYWVISWPNKILLLIFYFIRLKNANIAWNTNKCWSGWQGTLP